MTQPSAKGFAHAAHFIQNPPKFPGDKSQITHVAWQMDHRVELVNFWGIKPGSRVLELGCGQGDCTVVLADAVGENGHVDAVDPGPPDYGTPSTLAEAQAHIKATTLGPRISFYLSTDPIAFLSSLPPNTPPYDYMVLSHCIWYFESPSILSSIISASAKKTKYLCIAEWSLRSSLPSSQSHVLTALLRASLEAKRTTPSQGNIRTILSPKQIRSNVEATGGFRLDGQDVKVANEGMLDGYWEVSYTLQTREKTLARLREQNVPEKEIAAMVAGFDAVEANVELLDAPEGGQKVRGVRSMDFWVGRFVGV